MVRCWNWVPYPRQLPMCASYAWTVSLYFLPFQAFNCFIPLRPYYLLFCLGRSFFAWVVPLLPWSFLFCLGRSFFALVVPIFPWSFLCFLGRSSFALVVLLLLGLADRSSARRGARIPCRTIFRRQKEERSGPHSDYPGEWVGGKPLCGACVHVNVFCFILFLNFVWLPGHFHAASRYCVFYSMWQAQETTK